jgi:tetratricopeptide (TPR) repeat protein
MDFASIGIFMIFAQLLLYFFKKGFKAAVYGVAGLLFCVWLVASWSYNALWNNELNYAKLWVAESPLYNQLNMYIARAYFKAGQLDEALQHFKMALTDQIPDYVMYTDMGTISLLEGKLDDAKHYLQKALTIEPKASNALNSLAAVYVKLHDMDKAEECLKRAAAADPYDTDALKNLNYLYWVRSHPQLQSQPQDIMLKK